MKFFLPPPLLQPGVRKWLIDYLVHDQAESAAENYQSRDIYDYVSWTMRDGIQAYNDLLDEELIQEYFDKNVNDEMEGYWRGHYREPAMYDEEELEVIPGLGWDQEARSIMIQDQNLYIDYLTTLAVQEKLQNA